MVSLNDIRLTVRELIFDRFVVPTFGFKGFSGHTLSIIPPADEVEGSLVYDAISPSGSPITITLPLTATLDELVEQCISKNIVFAYTPYYVGSTLLSALIPGDHVLSGPVTLFRRSFFSDAVIEDMIRLYYTRVLSIIVDPAEDAVTPDPLAPVKNLNYYIPLLIAPSERHLVYWVAYYLVEQRRTYEAASVVIGNTYSDGSNYSSYYGSSSPTDITVSIGSVFTVREDPTNGFFLDDYNRLGSDNIWGDKYSFWYKLMLYLRQKMEVEFGYYGLRLSEVMESDIILERPQNFRSYFDSYPFTLSPLSRGIISP